VREWPRPAPRREKPHEQAIQDAQAEAEQGGKRQRKHDAPGATIRHLARRERQPRQRDAHDVSPVTVFRTKRPAMASIHDTEG
jgi:hypothetical protein